MSDVERDPTRTEDVEEALEKLEAHITGYPQMTKVSAKRKLNVVKREIRDLRELLEETQADLHHTKRKMVDPEEMHRARRRADRLEGVVREAKDLADYVYDRTFWRLNPDDDGNHHVDRETIDGMYKRASRVRDTVAALDSREDEGEHVLHKPGCSFIVNGTCNKGCADEPEGDEPSTFSELQAESLRSASTDEPVSGEGGKDG